MDEEVKNSECTDIQLMQPQEALKLIEKMIQGINPLSDETFKENHFCLNSDIKRALEATIPALEARIRWNEKQEKLPANAGKPWKDEEDEALGTAFDHGDDINVLALNHQRTVGSISARLVKMGKISP